MSGFAGIVRIAPSAESDELDRLAIERMARVIAFRGPDSLQQTRQPGASFAFSLLRTGPAPQEPAQPCTTDGETWFLGEARCDGREDLIRKLQQHGVSVSSSTPCEQIVLHVFSKFGELALADLDGDFSFVLWNPRKGRLLAFRDLTGARPFFYLYQDGTICFSNTLQAIFPHSAISRGEYDLQFVGNFLLGSQHYDPERTMYRDIRRLSAGNLLKVSSQGLSISRIANLPVEDLLCFRCDEEVVEEFRRLFTLAIRDRLPDSNTSIFLSGGLDSTSIAAAIVGLRKEKGAGAPLNLQALCVDFQPLFDDLEGQYASRVAKDLGIPLELVHSGHALPFAGWHESAITFPEPPIDPYALLYLSYRKEVSRNSRVVLSGDGGDEVLRLPAAPYLRFLASRQGLHAAFSALACWTLSHRRLPSLGFGIRSGLFRALGQKLPELTYPPWLGPDFERSQRLRERWLGISAPLRSAHPFNPKAYNALNNGLFSEVQEICDPAWTGVPLETRNPFLDRRLCRFLLRIPTIPWAMDKHLIRVSQRGILPEEIRLRGKTPVLHDPVVLHTNSGRWNPVSTDTPPALLRTVIDWTKVLESLRHASDTSLYLHLRPVALCLWLNAVEKENRIE